MSSGIARAYNPKQTPSPKPKAPSLTEAFSQPPVLNLNRLASMLDSGERSELFKLFFDSAAVTLENLGALSQQVPLDTVSACNELHAFKGACISIGAEKLASIAKQLEIQCRDNLHPDTSGWIAALERGLAELRLKLAPEMKA